MMVLGNIGSVQTQNVRANGNLKAKSSAAPQGCFKSIAKAMRYKPGIMKPELSPYLGNLKPPGWYAMEQEQYLREKLGDELFEKLERLVKRKKLKKVQRFKGSKVNPLTTLNPEP
jgi:hypothetical protein